jgi:hypothetical protein
MTQEFKKGDKVVCIDAKGFDWRVSENAEYTVVGVGADIVTIKDDDGGISVALSRRFKLAGQDRKFPFYFRTKYGTGLYKAVEKLTERNRVLLVSTEHGFLSTIDKSVALESIEMGLWIVQDKARIEAEQAVVDAAENLKKAQEEFDKAKATLQAMK